MIHVDGSFGEGGGQILRTSLGLSLVTGKPFNIINIRSGRKKPGLLRQHLTAVNAAQKIGRAVVKGNSIGSTSLYFEPEDIVSGDYSFGVGTAGSTTLVLQTILPALLFGKTASSIRLTGGTHNPFAPPFDFLTSSFLPCLEKMGAVAKCILKKYGFYPASGGEMICEIQPVKQLQPINLMTKGMEIKKDVVGIVSALPEKIAEKEVRIVCSRMGWDRKFGRAITVNSPGPGNILFVKLDYENICEVFTGFGQRGVSSEKVAGGVVDALEHYVESDIPVGAYLADQLLIPVALAGSGKFRTNTLSLHTKTNIEIIKKFLAVKIECDKINTNVWDIEIKGGSHEMGKE